MGSSLCTARSFATGVYDYGSLSQFGGLAFCGALVYTVNYSVRHAVFVRMIWLSRRAGSLRLTQDFGLHRGRLNAHAAVVSVPPAEDGFGVGFDDREALHLTPFLPELEQEHLDHIAHCCGMSMRI